MSEYFTTEWLKTLLAAQGIETTEAERLSVAKVLNRLNPIYGTDASSKAD